MLTCRYPDRNGLDMLPCEFVHTYVSDIYRNEGDVNFDLSIYNPNANVASSIYCAFICFSIDCLAFIFSPLSITCWQHIVKSICRKKTRIPLPHGSKLMVRKVGVLGHPSVTVSRQSDWAPFENSAGAVTVALGAQDPHSRQYTPLAVVSRARKTLRVSMGILSTCTLKRLLMESEQTIAVWCMNNCSILI
jgi:hypothetical protein